MGSQADRVLIINESHQDTKDSGRWWMCSPSSSMLCCFQQRKWTTNYLITVLLMVLIAFIVGFVVLFIQRPDPSSPASQQWINSASSTAATTSKSTVHPEAIRMPFLLSSALLNIMDGRVTIIYSIGRGNLYYAKSKTGLTPEFEAPMNFGHVGRIVSDIELDPVSGCLFLSSIGPKTPGMDGILTTCPNQMAMWFDNFHQIDATDIEDLAIDWISRNVYWTDSKNARLGMANLNGHNWIRLLLRKNSQQTILLERPRAIAVDPMEEVIFWTDWGSSPHLGRANLAGQNASILYQIERGFLNSIALDVEKKKLYLVDALSDTILEAEYGNGLFHVVKTISSPFLKHPFKMVVFRHRFLFWTDWSTKGINFHDNTGILNMNLSTNQIISVNTNSIQGIAIFDPWSKEDMNLSKNICNDFENGKSTFCPDGLCLYSVKSQNAVCTSENGRPTEASPSAEQPESTEQPPSSTSKVLAKSCSGKNDFLCSGSDECIPSSWLCDGHKDCPDNEDESSCSISIQTCNDHEFSCQSKPEKCIPERYVCDGDLDCPNGFDELDC